MADNNYSAFYPANWAFVVHHGYALMAALRIAGCCVGFGLPSGVMPGSCLQTVYHKNNIMCRHDPDTFVQLLQGACTAGTPTCLMLLLLAFSMCGPCHVKDGDRGRGITRLSWHTEVPCV